MSDKLYLDQARKCDIVAKRNEDDMIRVVVVDPAALVPVDFRGATFKSSVKTSAAAKVDIITYEGVDFVGFDGYFTWNFPRTKYTEVRSGDYVYDMYCIISGVKKYLLYGSYILNTNITD